MLAFITRGFRAREHAIEVVAQLLAQHGDALLFAGLLQPIRVQVDRARGEAIGTRRGRHGAAAQHSDRGEGREIARGPLADQLRKARLFAVQVEGLAGCRAKGAIA